MPGADARDHNRWRRVPCLLRSPSRDEGQLRWLDVVSTAALASAWRRLACRPRKSAPPRLFREDMGHKPLHTHRLPRPSRSCCPPMKPSGMAPLGPSTSRYGTRRAESATPRGHPADLLQRCARALLENDQPTAGAAGDCCSVMLQASTVRAAVASPLSACSLGFPTVRSDRGVAAVEPLQPRL